MGVIKTALEIALEKTQTVKSDKSSIDQFDARQKGKKTANSFLAGEADIAEIIKNTPSAQRDSLRQGIFEVLITQITLPAIKDEHSAKPPADEKRIEAACKGLQIVINNNRIAALQKQLMQVLSQYQQEAAQYEQAIRQQYAPKLRQKEEELSRRMGREVRIDPFQDPEFIAFYNQHMNALKGNYEAVISQFKEEARKLFDV
ncbi:MAG: hypothetical protein LBH16_08110 [Treponema sp.]|jgi:hypothetical protein|nr:hypothetical protein [Treponema sp.]